MELSRVKAELANLKEAIKKKEDVVRSKDELIVELRSAVTTHAGVAVGYQTILQKVRKVKDSSDKLRQTFKMAKTAWWVERAEADDKITTLQVDADESWGKLVQSNDEVLKVKDMLETAFVKRN